MKYVILVVILIIIVLVILYLEIYSNEYSSHDPYQYQLLNMTGKQDHLVSELLPADQQKIRAKLATLDEELVAGKEQSTATIPNQSTQSTSHRLAGSSTQRLVQINPDEMIYGSSVEELVVAYLWAVRKHLTGGTRYLAVQADREHLDLLIQDGFITQTSDPDVIISSPPQACQHEDISSDQHGDSNKDCWFKDFGRVASSSKIQHSGYFGKASAEYDQGNNLSQVCQATRYRLLDLTNGIGYWGPETDLVIPVNSRLSVLLVRDPDVRNEVLHYYRQMSIHPTPSPISNARQRYQMLTVVASPQTLEGSYAIFLCSVKHWLTLGVLACDHPCGSRIYLGGDEELFMSFLERLRRNNSTVTNA